MSDTNQTKAKQIFEEGDKVLQQISEVGAQACFQSLPLFQYAFELRDRCVRCIDEGTPGGVHLAGSGILTDIAQAEKALAEARVEGIYTHEECGAAKLYAQSEGLDPAYADEYCREWVQALCERMKIPYKGHLGIQEMQRPAGLHVARVVYYDGTGSFNNSIAGVPSGFVISRKYLDVSYAKRELEISIDIALGGHGFGELFTEQKPFYVIVLSNNKSGEYSTENLTNEIKPIVDRFNRRVVIDTISAQSEGKTTGSESTSKSTA